MATKTVIQKKTADEIKYERRVKSIELAIKSQGSRGAMSETVIKVAQKIFEYINS